MKRRYAMTAAAVAVLALTGATALLLGNSDTPAGEAKLGEPAPDFTLNDVYGKPFSLSEFRGKVVVVTFTSPRCPWSLGYDGAHRDWWKKYVAKDVQFLAVNPNRDEGVEEIRRHQVAKDLTLPTLKDPGNKVADVYGARTTPHVFIINKDGVLVYSGQPCDIGATATQPAVAKNSILPILDRLVAGETVEPSQTRPWGCTIKRGGAD